MTRACKMSGAPVPGENLGDGQPKQLSALVCYGDRKRRVLLVFFYFCAKRDYCALNVILMRDVTSLCAKVHLRDLLA